MSNTWRDDVFDSLVRLKRGHDLPNQNIVEGKFPIVASSGIKDFHNDYKAEPPIVVTGRSGTLGEVQYITQKSWPLNTTLYSIDFKGNYPKYVYYYLKEMHLENFNAGAGVPTLNQNHLQKLKIKIPSIEAQQKIAAILSAYDDLIENNKQRIKLLENMAEELYKEWFVRFRFPNWQNTEFEKGVPRGWETCNLESLGNVKTGKTPSTLNAEFYGGEFPFYKTPDMHNTIFVFDTEETLTEQGLNSQKSQVIEENSIMVTCIGTGGVTAIATKKGCTNQQINTLTLSNPKYLCWAFYTIKGLKAQIELFGATGATMTNLSKGKFCNLQIVKPAKTVIEKYFDTVSPMFDLIKNLSLENAQLNQQKNSLLPRLISGKLSVQQLNIHYPPSML